MIWSFEEFVRGSTGNEKGIVSDDLDAGPKAELDVILTEHLGLKIAREWTMPDYLPLGDGLGEIRWNCNRVEFRAYGSFEKGMVFRIWLIATKSRKRKGKQLTDPPDAVEKARKKKRDYENQQIGKVRRYE
jgi:hypothetical protein